MIYTPYSDINVRLIRTNHAWLSSSMYTAQHIDSTARSHVRFFEFLHQLEWNFLLMEEFLNHAVPGLVEGFIHGEHGE